MRGKKTSTWRINDEKNIADGDELSLRTKDDMEFAKAVVVSVKKTVFGNLSDADKLGHEKFANDEEMYEIYSGYYNMKVTPETAVKIIKFRLA